MGEEGGDTNDNSTNDDNTSPDDPEYLRLVQKQTNFHHI